jgi:hypothetical protein
VVAVLDIHREQNAATWIAGGEGPRLVGKMPDVSAFFS